MTLHGVGHRAKIADGYLLYACSYLLQHLNSVRYPGHLLSVLGPILSGPKFLYMLEVLEEPDTFAYNSAADFR